MLKRAISFLIMVSLLTPSAEAVRHIKPGAYPNAAQDKIGHPPASRIRAMGSRRAAIIGGATGTKNVAVIIVQFPAGNGSLISGSRSIVSLANINTRFSQMAAYFSEVSYGAMTLNFRFFGNGASGNTGEATAMDAGSYTMAQPMEYYGCGDEGVGCSGVTTPTGFVSANGNYLIAHAIEAARLDVGGPTSTTNGGTFDAIIVLHAGNGNETTVGTAGDIWSIFYSQDNAISGTNPVNATVAAAGFTQGAVFPETESSGITSALGVMCHEFGHELGLPDLYNTTLVGGSSVVGDWELMDSGPFVANGANPSHLSAWSKAKLGWVTPTVAGNDQTVSLPHVESSANGMIRINAPNGLPQEYFLVEHRTRGSAGTYDKAIPGDGLLIWHVDDAIMTSRGIDASTPSEANTVNNGVPHYGLSLVTANGASPSTGGTAGNAFTNGDIFITPQSDNFEGEPSGVSILNISGVGGANATFTVAALAVSAGQSITKLVNYPNPAGKGYSHPSGEGNTTIQFQLTRPAKDYSLNIYTLSADLVRKVPKGDINLNITRSDDHKWVYEYLWNLTNSDGAHVAPGVYLYLIRADGENKSGKAVIIR